MGVDVDEPGGDHVPPGIDHLTGLGGAVEFADGLDRPRGDPDVARKPRIAAAVRDTGVDDYRVEHSAPPRRTSRLSRR